MVLFNYKLDITAFHNEKRTKKNGLVLISKTAHIPMEKILIPNMICNNTN